jgi:hypothetical protein
VEVVGIVVDTSSQVGSEGYLTEVRAHVLSPQGQVPMGLCHCMLRQCVYLTWNLPPTLATEPAAIHVPY